MSKNARQSREQSGDRNGGGRRSYYPEDGGDADGDGGRAGGECRGKDQRCDPGDILGMMTVGEGSFGGGEGGQRDKKLKKDCLLKKLAPS